MKDGQKSKHNRVNLTSDRIDRLQQIGFDFNPRKRGRPSISGSSNTSCSSSKRQRVKERVEPSTAINEELEEIEGDIIPKWLLHDNEEEEDNSGNVLDENEEMEEIEGDIVPRWLLHNEEEEEDNSGNMLDEIYIKVEGEIEVEGRSNNVGYTKFSHEGSEEGIFICEKDNAKNMANLLVLLGFLMEVMTQVVSLMTLIVAIMTRVLRWRGVESSLKDMNLRRLLVIHRINAALVQQGRISRI